ncbi:hypothetical protein AVEN_249935-1 [Araneus ventricosus]|uniref:Uncharacterized protein n=1 Tax=Araneus ventricosus TaxID=182803 RepID=A0A4Y2DXN9_ARAVE|nr:hypothetical protein AVEN_249935-1 [Araneus ventricosus]
MDFIMLNLGEMTESDPASHFPNTYMMTRYYIIMTRYYMLMYQIPIHDDIPSYQKPSFPSCTSSSSQGSSRRRRDGKGVVNELSCLTQFASLSEKYGDSAAAETADKGENNEVISHGLPVVISGHTSSLM